MNKQPLALIMDYHPNFYDTYKELEKHYDLTMFGSSYYPVPSDINFVEWETKRLGSVYVGSTIKLHLLLKGFKLAIIKDMFQPKSLTAVNVCKRKKIKYIVVIQTITKPYLLPFVKMVVGKDTPIVCSIDNTEIVKKYFNNVSYIPLSIKIPNNYSHVKNKIFKVLCVGRLDLERKNQILVIDTLNKMDYNFELVLIGSKQENNAYYKKLIRKSCTSFPTNVYISTNLNKKEVSLEYQCSDLFILATINEPCNYTIVEAMAYGLPVISSLGNCSCSYLNNNNMVFSTQDELISSIEYALLRYKVISIENKYLIKQNHDVVKNVDKLIKMFELCPYIGDYRDW